MNVTRLTKIIQLAHQVQNSESPEVIKATAQQIASEARSLKDDIDAAVCGLLNAKELLVDIVNVDNDKG